MQTARIVRPPGQYVEACPLDRDDQGVTQREAREAHLPESQAPGPRGEGRKGHDRLEPRLREEIVAHPHRVEEAGGLGVLRCLEEHIGREAEQDGPVRQADAESDRLSHGHIGHRAETPSFDCAQERGSYNTLPVSR